MSEQYFWKFFWTVFLDSILHQFWLILFLDHIFQPAASLDRYFPGKWSIFFWVSLIHIFIIDHHHRYYPQNFCLENWTKKNYLDNWTEKIYLENLTEKILSWKPNRKNTCWPLFRFLNGPVQPQLGKIAILARSWVQIITNQIVITLSLNIN